MGKISKLTSCLTGVGACQTVKSSRAAVLLLAMVALLLSGRGTAFGQAQNTGSIYGQVTDPTGAVVPGATVTVAEPNKGVNRVVTASKTGEFVQSNLSVGTYIMTVTAPGFETYVGSDIAVDADKSVKLEVKLTVGSASESVQVDAGGTALDTNSATLGTLMDNKLVEELPIDGRNVVALAGLLPGVTDLNAPATNTSDRGGPTYSVSGSRNTQNLMLFDGLMWNNLFFNTGINYPPPNALQEISVLLNNFKAQYGRNAGSVFNVVTKRGTNQIHGAVWDYVQSRAFNAADYLTHENPTDNSNQLGFTVEGPIKADKLFYAVTFQDLIQHLQVAGTSIFAQGLAERGLQSNGSGGYSERPCTPGPYPAGTSCASFLAEVTPQGGTTSYGKFINPQQVDSTSGLDATALQAQQMIASASSQAGIANNPCWSLLTQVVTSYASSVPYYNQGIQKTYLPNAEVPTVCLNPVLNGNYSLANPFAAGANPSAAGFLNHYLPLPNGLTAKGQPEATTLGAQPRNDRNALIRIDWVASTRHTIDARYNLIDADDATAPGVNSSSQGVPTYEISANHAVSNFGNIGDTWVVTPNIVNTFRVGYKRYIVANPPLDHNTWNTFGGNFVEPGIPVAPVINVSGSYKLGSTGQANASVVNEDIEVLDQITWTRGNHNFQFGANFLRLQYLNKTDYPGTLSFSTTFTGLAPADESLGLLTSIQANSRLIQGGINHSIFSYIQDDWRATPKLTINLGIRYELPFQWYQPNGQSSTFIPGHQSTKFPGAIGGLAYPGDQGVLPSLVPTDFNGIAPRFGFAYDVYGTGRLAIRGGFGMFSDAINADVIGEGEPYYFQYFAQLPPGGASVPLQNSADTTQGVRVIPAGYNPKAPQFEAPYSLFFPDKNFRTPYYEAGNVGFELRVDRGGVLDTNYVLKLGRKLTIPFDLNPAITDCSGGYYQANYLLYGNASCKALTGNPNGNASSQVTSTQARLRYTPFNYGGGGLVDFASIGTSNYNGLQVQFTQRGGKSLTIISSYTYSKSIDLQTNSQSTSNVIPNVFNVNSERGLSDYDARHIFNMGWVLRLPNPTSNSLIVRQVFSNWEYAGKFITHSGKPYNVTINNDTALDGEPNQRAAIVAGASPYLPKNRHRLAKVNEYFNVNAFTYPITGTFSNVPRNAFIGPGYIQTDMSLARSFPLTSLREGMRFMFRAEAFNVFNTPNLSNPSGGFSCTTTTLGVAGSPNGPCNATNTTSSNVPSLSPTSTFGQVLSTFGNNGNTSTNGRRMQFSGTLFF